MEEAREILPLIQARHPKVLITSTPDADGLKLAGYFELECDWADLEWGPKDRECKLASVVEVLVKATNVTAYAIHREHNVLQKILVFRVFCNGNWKE